MKKTTDSKAFQSEKEIRELVTAFEHATLARSEWDHRAHLTVALWYLINLDECQASSAVIDGIQRFNRAKGIRRTPTSGYHETLTLFWLGVARSYLKEYQGRGSILDRINHFVDIYSDREDLFLDYYSRKRIFSWNARYYWVEPDLRPLDFVEEFAMVEPGR